MTAYISRTDTAKLIRKALKEHFSDIKFSVKCRAGGSSIEVTWTDGPTTKSVNKVVKVFEGASFDGMYDLKTYKNSALNGEEVHFGADYVMTHRKTTRTFVEAIIAAFCKAWGCDPSRIEIRGTDQEARGDAWNLGLSEDHFFNELLDGTDAKDMYRPYEAAEEREQAEREEWARNAPQRHAQEERERQETAKREEERRQQEAKREQERIKAERERQEHARQQETRRFTLFYTREQALQYLGLSFSSSDTMINATFRQRVKNAADGKGGYTEDMDKLVKAKEKALQR